VSVTPRQFVTQKTWVDQLDQSELDTKDIHRGVRLELPTHEVNRLYALKPEDRAAAVIGHLQKQDLGEHWTADSEVAKDFATTNAERGNEHMPVVLHAHHPGWDKVNTDPASLKGKTVLWDGDNPFQGAEAEVPLRRGVGVHVTGVSTPSRREDFMSQARRGDWTHTPVTHEGRTAPLEPGESSTGVQGVSEEQMPRLQAARRKLAPVTLSEPYPQVQQSEAHMAAQDGGHVPHEVAKSSEMVQAIKSMGGSAPKATAKHQQLLRSRLMSSRQFTP